MDVAGPPYDDQGPGDTGDQGAVADLGWPLTEAELTELALAADPDSLWPRMPCRWPRYLRLDPGLLPSWYMPTPMTRSHARWRLPVVVALIAAFVIIEAFGLCSTFGQLVPA